MSSLHRIFYVSLCQTDWAGVSLIVQTAQRYNPRRSVTGALVFTGGHFAQWLEGDGHIIDELSTRIAGDARHVRMNILSRQPISERRFGHWSMGFEERLGADDLLGELLQATGGISAERADRLLEQLVSPEKPRGESAGP